MRKWLFLFFILFACVGARAQKPVLGQTTPPAVNQGQTFTFTCTANCTGVTWSCTTVGGCLGAINSSTGVYTAAATVTPHNIDVGCQLLPNDHIYNTRIDSLPVNTNSAAWIAQDNFGHLLPNQSIPTNVVTGSTTTQSLVFFESLNNGNFQFPLPPTGQMEGGWDPNAQLDHHMENVNPTTCHVGEIYFYYTPGFQPTCPTCNSQAGVQYDSSTFALNQPLTTNGTTDAAGMSIAPLMDHFQEWQNAVNTGGEIMHATRITMRAAALGNGTFLWPATDADFTGFGSIPFGARVRLKSTFDISGFSVPAQKILLQLQHYGAFVDDTGSDWEVNLDEGKLPYAYAEVLNEISSANIVNTDFEFVDESSLEVSSTSGATTNSETICATNGSGSTCINVVPVGVTIGVAQNELDIQAGSPAQQLQSFVNGSSNQSVTWTASPALSGTIIFDNTAVTTTGGSGATGTSVSTANFKSLTGNFLVCGVRQTTDTTAPSSVKDAAGDSFTHVTAVDSTPDATHLQTVWFLDSITAGNTSDAVTATWSVSHTGVAMVCRQYYVNGATLSVDVSAQVSSDVNLLTTISTGSLTTTSTTNELAVDFLTTNGGSSGANPIIGQTATNSVASAGTLVASSDFITTSVITGVTTWNFGVSDNTMAAVVAFKGTGGSGIYGTLTSGGLYTPPATIPAPAVLTVTATASASPNPTASFPIAIQPTGSIRIQMGGPCAAGLTITFPVSPFNCVTTGFTDSHGNIWYGETADNGGSELNCGAGVPPWPNTTDIGLYEIPYTSSSGDLIYKFIVPNGTYSLDMKFAGGCSYNDAVGQNSWDIEVQGGTVFSNVDIISTAGGAMLPADFTVSSATVSNNQLQVALRFHKGNTGAFMSALSITPISAVVPVAPVRAGLLLGD